MAADMKHSSTDGICLGATAQNLLRIVIASYFLAVALNLIPGTDLTLLFLPVMSQTLATALSAGLVFGLAFLVMVGLYMRPAALVLGLMTLFSSYLKMVQLGVSDELGMFWRDLVLIAALMMTYAESAPRDYYMRKMIRERVVPRRVRGKPGQHAPRPTRMPQALAATMERQTRYGFLEIEEDADIDNIFADDGDPRPVVATPA